MVLAPFLFMKKAENMKMPTQSMSTIKSFVRKSRLILLSECFQLPIDALLHDAPACTPEEAKEQQLKMLWSKASDHERDTILSIIKVILNKNENHHN